MARVNNLHTYFIKLGYRMTAIEVASQDATYGFPDTAHGQFEHICCFPRHSYHRLGAKEIHNKVLTTLKEIQPDIVFAPATPFPEGMAAYLYRLRYEKKAVMMDDAWEHTDSRGGLTSTIKKLIHNNIDAAFIPAQTHLPYYQSLGFPPTRAAYGVDVVDNNYYSNGAENARRAADKLRSEFDLPDNYFLFVGRFLPRKGIENLIDAYKLYRRKSSGKPWGLVLVGSGDHLSDIQKQAVNCPRVIFPGPKFGDDLCNYYGLASTLVVPSLIDQWGLVVNEGMASSLPVIVSEGCGAAKTLVAEGKNGWTFPPENVERLCDALQKAASLKPEVLEEFGATSQKIIADWSLDRFAEGVLSAIKIPRRAPAGFLSNLATRFWKGRVSVN